MERLAWLAIFSELCPFGGFVALFAIGGVGATRRSYVLPAREPSGLRRLWATHPRLERRIERLDEMERQLQAARPVLGDGRWRRGLSGRS